MADITVLYSNLQSFPRRQSGGIMHHASWLAVYLAAKVRCDCLVRFLILYMAVRNDKEVKEELRSVWWLLEGIGDRINSAAAALIRVLAGLFAS